MRKLFAIFFLAMNIGVAQQDEEINEEVHLRIKNRFKYKATFTYTVDEFLTLPYLKDDYFESEKFPKDNDNGVHWYFSITPEFYREGRPRYQGADVQVRLKLASLPKNIAAIKASFECGIRDKNGKLIHAKAQTLTKLEVDDEFNLDPFLNRNDLDKKKDSLLPDRQLTLICKVDGHLIYDNVQLPTDVKKQYVLHPKCGRNVAIETIQNLIKAMDSNLSCTDAIVKASGKEYTRHKEILSSTSTALRSKMSGSNILDFGDEMNGEELADFLSFLYQGTASNLDRSCRTLLVVAKKYDLDCLRQTCEEVLIGKVNGETASDLLVFAEKNAAFKLVKAAGLCLSKYPNCTRN